MGADARAVETNVKVVLHVHSASLAVVFRAHDPPELGEIGKVCSMSASVCTPVEIKAPRPITLEFQAPFNMPLLNVQPLQRYRGILVKVIYEHDVFVYVSKL
jgi:hypothetical protein